MPLFQAIVFYILSHFLAVYNRSGNDGGGANSISFFTPFGLKQNCGYNGGV